MKGLDLAEAYYYEYGAPMLEGQFSDNMNRLAVGFVGPGSECFGFDDEISRDHDWGPGFCIWLTDEDALKIGQRIQEEYERLPKIYRGFGPRIVSPGEETRTGACATTDFYRRYTGLNHPPATNKEWLAIPEQSLALCTNGRVFFDPLGDFSKRRDSLLGYYPEDVRLKKMASRCMTASQAGQYNFERSLKRNERFAALYAETQFCMDVFLLIFLFNKQYAPFYKWMHRAVRGLPVLGEKIYGMISMLINLADMDEKKSAIEGICALIIEELHNQGLSDSDSDFLLDHAHHIHGKIKDRELGGRFWVVS
ncbi:MAG: DUF4037 domain-containing protein [Deltaproteobacteria bacterium]|nr:DUF4037 domain-containing protein [Deltaproteobacteria bacterium]